MENPNIFYKYDIKRLELKSELKGVYFTKPRLVAYYDVNYDSVEPAKNILYFKLPKAQKYPIDLKIGYETYIERKKSLVSKSLEYTLKYVMSPEAQINVDSVDKIKVYARRGTFVELMSCFYRKNYTKCTIRVSRYNEDLYMVHVEDDEHFNLEPKHTHHEQFLKNVFTESLKNDPNINEPTNENKRLIGVHQSNFGKFEVIYHGGIQGIQAQKELKNFNDLEILNACRFVMAKQIWSFLKKDHIKYLKYWLEGYLANVSDIYFAYKDKNGIVSQPIIHKLPSKLIKESKWKPGICTEFLYEFLQRVNDLMTSDKINSLKTVYEIYFDSKFKTFTYKVFKENTDKIFITEEYMEYCKKL